MKSFAGFSTLALVAYATAAPSYNLRHAKRQTVTPSCILDTVMNPSQDQVIASINQWLTDVTTVNAFLNTVSNVVDDASALVTATENVAVFAADEPCQLMTLNSTAAFNGASAGFTCAINDLVNVFQAHVLDNLAIIEGNPGNLQSVHNAVDDINNFRCCNVLPDVDIVWQESADENGVSNVVTITAPRADACASIDCSTISTASNCKSLGFF